LPFKPAFREHSRLVFNRPGRVLSMSVQRLGLAGGSPDGRRHLDVIEVFNAYLNKLPRKITF
jgi:hypothetical protein